MRMTYPQRILSILTEKERKNQDAIFNSKVAGARFRRVRNIDGTIMRTARRMRSYNMLRRISAGKYVLTSKGRKAVSE